jgi:hypothetical protein
VTTGTILLAIAEVGTAVQLEETLGKVGLATRWDRAAAAGPTGPLGDVAVVIIDADRAGAELPAVVDRWRAHPEAPGLVAIGAPAAREHANAARITLLAAAATPATLRDAIALAARLRYANRLAWSTARRALGLPDGAADTAEAAAVIAAARSVDVDVPRAALRWHAQDYVTDKGAIAILREARALTIPEVEQAAALDGTLTLQSVVRAGPLDGAGAARLVWALACVGGVALTPEPYDVATPGRRKLAAIRADLRARMARLEGATFYDVLEVTPLADYKDLEAAYEAVARRYAPMVLAKVDLADLAQHVEPMWKLVEKARSVLTEIAARGRYHDWLRANHGKLKTVWAIDPDPALAAIEAYGKGQAALGDGDAHRALSHFAAACRHQPGHPEYEAGLAWARYRVEVAAGKDRAERARVERRAVEAVVTGTRGWPRALLTLALLCAADEDRDAARFHVQEALALDPRLAGGQQLLARLGR